MNRTLEFQTLTDSLRVQHGSCKHVIKDVNHTQLRTSTFASEISHKIDEIKRRMIDSIMGIMFDLLNGPVVNTCQVPEPLVQTSLLHLGKPQF